MCLPLREKCYYFLTDKPIQSSRLSYSVCFLNPYPYRGSSQPSSAPSLSGLTQVQHPDPYRRPGRHAMSFSLQKVCSRTPQTHASQALNISTLQGNKYDKVCTATEHHQIRSHAEKHFMNNYIIQENVICFCFIKHVWLVHACRSTHLHLQKCKTLNSFL